MLAKVVQGSASTGSGVGSLEPAVKEKPSEKASLFVAGN